MLYDKFFILIEVYVYNYYILYLLTNNIKSNVINSFYLMWNKIRYETYNY
jgi:hypothetical protein